MTFKGKKTSEYSSKKMRAVSSSSGNNNNGSNSKGKSAKKIKGKQKKAVQVLYDTCKEVFADCGPGVVPSADKIAKLKAVMDNMKASDVGLNPDMQYFRKNGKVPSIQLLEIHECDKFQIVIFCLPPSGVIPLHDHPGMTVFGKLLFGTMKVRSYDWVAGRNFDKEVAHLSPATHPGAKLAKLKVNAEITAPCDTRILYPADGGNMHRFAAVTACAVLDVLGPPYSDNEGRPCAYYLEHPFTKFSVDGVSVPEEEKEEYAWLEKRKAPKSLVILSAVYTGPKIVTK